MVLTYKNENKSDSIKNYTGFLFSELIINSEITLKNSFIEKIIKKYFTQDIANIIEAINDYVLNNERGPELLADIISQSNLVLQSLGIQNELSTSDTLLDMLNVFENKNAGEAISDIDLMIQNYLVDGSIEMQKLEDDGKPCAATGIKTNKFTPGGKWEVVKKFKGPSHKQGGIDITIKDGKVGMSNKDGDIEAKDGLVIKAEKGLVEKQEWPEPIAPKIGSSAYAVKDKLNPLNILVPDYTKEGAFDQAYSKAIKEETENFMYGNKKFSTQLSDQEQIDKYGITFKQ
jgi:hypothetical protein